MQPANYGTGCVPNTFGFGRLLFSSASYCHRSFWLKIDRSKGFGALAASSRPSRNGDCAKKLGKGGQRT